MPSILSSVGFPQTARPNVYTRVDASALAGGALESGNIAIVGDFPSFQSATPVVFSSRRSMINYDQSDLNLKLLAQLSFNPSDDPNASGGASSVSIVNSRTGAVRSSIDLAPISLLSKIYGLTANRLRSTLSISGDTHTLQLERNGLTEEHKIENDALATITTSLAAGIEVKFENGTVTVTSGASTLSTITSAEANSLSGVIALINALDDVSATLVEAQLIKIAELDYINLTIAQNATENVKAPAYLLMQSLLTSNLVTATLDNSNTAGTLTAGTLTASNGAQGGSLDVTAALAAIENVNIQIVVLFSFESAHQTLLGTHLSNSANAGYERQAYTSIPSSSTLAQVKTRATLLNNAGIALASQSFDIINTESERQTLDSRYLAVIFAAMQAGSDIGEPLTRKRPRVLSVSQTWDNYADIEQALRSGTIILTTDNLGLRIERSITTYLTDNNPVFSEISAYESVLSSLRDIRLALADQIGRPTKSSQVSLISSRVNSRLTAQVRDGIIKAFQNIQLEDLGDQVAVNYEVAPVEPLNFISLTAIAVRIPNS